MQSNSQQGISEKKRVFFLIVRLGVAGFLRHAGGGGTMRVAPKAWIFPSLKSAATGKSRKMPKDLQSRQITSKWEPHVRPGWNRFSWKSGRCFACLSQRTRRSAE